MDKHIFGDGIPTPTLFAKLMFGWDAFDYQVAPLNDLSKRQLIACGRQVGKTEMAAIKGLYNAVMNEGTTTLILSPTQRQSGILFRRMKELLNKNSRMDEDKRIPINETIVRETQTIIEFANGSQIISIPAAEDGSNVRGFTSNMLIVDEAGFLNDQVFVSVVPMLATTKGTLMLIGTPNGVNNYFHKCFSNKNLGFSVYQFPSEASPIIDPEFLKGQREIMSDVEYSQEFGAQFIDTKGAMFTFYDLMENMKKDCPVRYEPLNSKTYEYSLGYDPAGFGEDTAVACIIEHRPDLSTPHTPYAAVSFHELNGKSIPEQIRFLKVLYAQWRFKRMVIDATGLGQGISDDLIQAGLPVEPLVISIKSKQEMYFNLKKMLEANELMLPLNEKLKKEMLELKRETRSDGYTIISHPKGGHDDRVSALCLAVWAGTRSPPQEIIFFTAKGVFR